MITNNKLRSIVLLIAPVVIVLIALFYFREDNRDQNRPDKESRQSISIAEPKGMGGGSITTREFISTLLSRDIEHEIRSRTIDGSKSKDLFDLNLYYYDFENIRQLEQQIADLDTRDTLKLLFQEVTNNLKKDNHRKKWLIFSDFISKVMRHPPLAQPRYKDRTEVLHPLVLLLLGEGRCNQVARVIVDTALANGYKARLVYLAAHVVAEVKYNGSWHFVDADADFPLEELEKLGDIPSLLELANKPYLIDTFPSRGWQWSEHDKRSTSNSILSHAMLYPATLLTSSIYFGDQILRNLYLGDPSKPRGGLTYYYKNHKKGSFKRWQKDRYYGWRYRRSETQKIKPIPIEFFPPRPRVMAPSIVYQKNQSVKIPFRFLPVKRIRIEDDDVFNIRFDKEDIKYEVNISSQSRGWNYDFRNYRYMPKLGKGDIRKITTLTYYSDGSVGLDLELKNVIGDIFIEVIPRIKSLEKRGTFMWPSPELHIQIYPENYREWKSQYEYIKLFLFILDFTGL
jgi:hypothetical protein